MGQRYGSISRVPECLLCTCKTLSSNPSPIKQKWNKKTYFLILWLFRKQIYDLGITLRHTNVRIILKRYLAGGMKDGLSVCWWISRVWVV
jgi:hypothetical protein